MTNQISMPRRTFLASAGAGLALAQKGPNDQVVIGMIGVGNQGTGRLRELLKEPDVRIGAICDVDSSHRDRAIELVQTQKGYKPDGFGDFRRLLEKKDIDAVSIITPDHWHAIPTVNAFEAGKDVFVEKPLSFSLMEGRAMADGTLLYKRVSQMGNHIHNDHANYRRVVELVKSGKLGKITRVHAWKTSPTKNITGRAPATLPAGFDYDFWLGPAPKRPYEPLRSHGSFRHFWDYSGGTFIDFWCHISDVAFWAMDWKAPQAISASGGRFFLDDATETPDTIEAILEFPGMLYLFSFRPTPLPGFEHMGHIGCLFEGTEASLVTNYETNEVWVRGKKVEDFPRPTQSIPDSPGHVREFLDAVKTRNMETTCNLRYGHQLSKCGLLANISYRLGRKIHWDDAKERISGDSEANQQLSRKFRKPWKLKMPKHLS
ncbi:MAG TPA: Gfo/Idh/MocA family oxidoreductase [Bryobacteraceae bacterium]|nr:Gfo/Idh/MocA family oxidoreductase [Bryobacteraceae bacterium]